MLQSYTATQPQSTNISSQVPRKMLLGTRRWHAIRRDHFGDLANSIPAVVTGEVMIATTSPVADPLRSDKAHGPQRKRPLINDICRKGPCPGARLADDQF